MAPAVDASSACSFWQHSNSHMYMTYNSKLPQLKCGWWVPASTKRYKYWLKTDWTSIKYSRQPNLLCFWFQCCSLSLAIQSSWLITQPIAASGQSQALYDSSQTTDRGVHSARLLFAHAPSSRVHHVCRLYRLLLCIVIKTFFQDVGKWILDFKGWGQCTMNISHVTVWSKSLYHPHMR